MVYIIAEAGVNHNGSVEQALQLIDVAARAGANAVKFQTFKAASLVSKKACKAEYQQKTTDADESQFSMLKKLELDLDAHKVLLNHCREAGIQFLSTPFDIESMHFLNEELNVPLFKVSSGDITNLPLLLAMAETKKPVILSTGMSTLADIEMAIGVLAFGYVKQSDEQPSRESFRKAYSSLEGQAALKTKVTLLHCTTEYPTPMDEVNLRVLDTLKASFDLTVGMSDHTEGIVIPVAAVARGAQVIEKHFTLDRSLPGPDHKASLEPLELCEMVKAIRNVELALGTNVKQVTRSESGNIDVARKSIVASRSIAKGERFTEENLAVKRPGNGLSPVFYWDIIGKMASKDYGEEEKIEL